MERTFDVLVIGAGASGLAAAAAAAKAGASVLVLEKNHVPGRKVLSTGAGKCNFSNLKISPSHYHGAPAAFLKKTFSVLPPAKVTGFFSELGLLFSADDNGRLFPRSMKAQDVVAVLVNELGVRGAQLLTLTEVTSITPGQVISVTARKVPPQWEKRQQGGETLSFRARKVILAAGGPCYPQIGGTSAGFDLLRSLGHSVQPPRPVMAPLRCREQFLKELDGVRAEAGLALIPAEGKPHRSRGEVLFTDYGLSGPAALELSRAAGDALASGPVTAEVDLFPDFTAAALRKLLQTRLSGFGPRPFSHFAAGLHNEKLLKTAATLAELDWRATVAAAPEETLERFFMLLKALPLTVTGVQGFSDAMVSAGGCPAAEVEPSTYASRKIAGLYVTGELLDVDGDSGGYNLHFAWTTGLLAGKAAAGSRNQA